MISLAVVSLQSWAELAQARYEEHLLGCPACCAASRGLGAQCAIGAALDGKRQQLGGLALSPVRWDGFPYEMVFTMAWADTVCAGRATLLRARAG